MRSYKLFVILAILLLVGCNREPSTIIIPENCNFINYTDSLQITELMNKPLKIMVWADSTGCTGCKLQLDTWGYAISELDSIFPDSLGYLFFLQFKERENLEFLLGIDNPEDYIDSDEYLDDVDEKWTMFPLPVVWDAAGVFGKTNKKMGINVSL